MSAASFDPVAAVLLIPIGSAALLAVLPGYRLSARLNVIASLATFLAALSLFIVQRPPPGPYVLIDDLNIVFIALNTFVGFTTSLFSASYIAHELEAGPPRRRGATASTNAPAHATSPSFATSHAASASSGPASVELSASAVSR